MDFKEQRLLIDSVLADWPDWKRERVCLMFRNRKVISSCVTDTGRLVTAVAKCHPFDRYDARSGALMSLSLLRIRCAYKESSLAKKLKLWVPFVGQAYFIPSWDGSAEENGISGASRCIWFGSVHDAVSLSLGLVFHTAVEARKKAKQLLFEGRASVNFARKRDYYRKPVSSSAAVPDDTPVPDDTDPAVVFNETVEPGPVSPEEFTMIPVTPESAADREWGDDANTLNEVNNELYQDEDMFHQDIESGRRYYMDPVTGELVATGEDSR